MHFGLPLLSLLSTHYVQHLTHKEVVNRLNNETVSYEADFESGGGSFSEMMRVMIKAEMKHYQTAIVWLKNLIYGSIFDPYSESQS